MRLSRVAWITRDVQLIDLAARFRDLAGKAIKFRRNLAKRRTASLVTVKCLRTIATSTNRVIIAALLACGDSSELQQFERPTKQGTSS